MKKIALGILVWLAASAAWAQPGALDAIVRDPFRFDRRVVILRGVVGLVDSVGARPAFQLIDGAWTIRVVAPPFPAVRPGDRVEVEGTFSHADNQIDAIRVSPR